MRIYLSAGEPSGDLHAARLVRELRALLPDATFAGFGGERMRAAGVDLRANLADRAIMGVIPVLKEIGSLLGLVGGFLEEIERDPPDLLVLVDYPGMNLNLARMARARGIPVIYYICPQIWAWAPWRLKRIARRADRLLVVIPFEVELYREAHAEVEYVGNPVFDHLSEFERTHARTPSGAPFLAVLPGSRRQEVAEALPVMLGVARTLVAHDPRLAVRVSCQRASLRPVIDQAIAGAGVAAEVVEGVAHALQRDAHLSLVVSGTATLEQAYFGVPMVVLYPASKFEQRAFDYAGVTPFIALANVFAGRAVVPEFLFTPADEPRIAEAAVRLLDGEPRAAMLADLARLRAEMFLPGASVRAANAIASFLARKGAKR